MSASSVKDLDSPESVFIARSKQLALEVAGRCLPGPPNSVGVLKISPTDIAR